MSSPSGHPDVAILVGLALSEDRVARDVTSQALVPESARARGRVVVRESGVVAGLVLLQHVSPLLQAFPGLEARCEARDGHSVSAGQQLAVLSGPARELDALVQFEHVSVRKLFPSGKVFVHTPREALLMPPNSFMLIGARINPPVNTV